MQTGLWCQCVTLCGSMLVDTDCLPRTEDFPEIYRKEKWNKCSTIMGKAGERESGSSSSTCGQRAESFKMHS